MREITTHRVNPANDKLKIHVLDEPGSGGACHVYRVGGFDPTCSHAFRSVPGVDFRYDAESDSFMSYILFQCGPIAEHGVNGITQEVLLAIVADRLQSFQQGPYACRENAVALTQIETAQLWLQKRTLERMARGVEGTNQK